MGKDQRSTKSSSGFGINSKKDIYLNYKKEEKVEKKLESCHNANVITDDKNGCGYKNQTRI